MTQAPAPKKATKKTAGKKATPKKAAAPKKTTQPKKAAEPPKPTAAKQPVPKKTPAKPVTPKPAAPKPRPVRAAKLDAATLKGIKQQLESELHDLQAREDALEQESERQTDLREAGVNDDFADAGTATFDRERDLSIRNNIRDLIDQITRALRRVDDGTYGTCERCGRPIDAARLKALPHALLCMDCKRREERAR